MGRERVEYFRESDIKPKEKIVVLSYEGNHTEALYFEALKETVRFNDEQIHLHSLRRPNNDTKSAPIHVFQKLKKEVKDLYNLNPEDELWMIIDRDSWQNIPVIHQMCVDEGNFYLALSNPCFEFWLLLHIRDMSNYTKKQKAEMFENLKITAKKTFLKAHLSDLLGGYKETNIKPERFLPTIDDAIARAKVLDTPNETFPTRLGSHVYKLAERIILPK